LEQGVDPASILLLTFTNKAARQMLDRVVSLVGNPGRVWGGTFHSTANRMLRATAKTLGYTSDFTILDQEDSRSLIKVLMKELKIDYKARRFPSPAVVQEMISFQRNTTTAFNEALEMKHPNFLPLQGEIEELSRMYEVRKREANSMDFDDLLINWLRLVEHPEIGAAMSRRFKYILVDEYQDTNALQARIVRGLSRAHQNVLVVGDDAQSIYAFRGADVKNILHFPEEWFGVKIFKLLTNYRSAPEILELANESLAKNVAQFEKALVGVKPHGRKPLIVPTASVRQEAQFIAEQILALRGTGVALPNIAVLFRSAAHSQALEFELMKRDIPYEYRGGMKFFGRAHIKDVLAHLRVIQNCQDEPAWLRIFNLQSGIGAVTASRFAAAARTASSIAEVISADLGGLVSDRSESGWGALKSILQKVVEHKDDSSSMIRTVISSSYRDYLEREYPDWHDRMEDLEQLAMFAEGYKSAAEFLADISLYDEAITLHDTNPKPREERVILSTVHQAKGLEWDTVFVMHLTDNGFPNKYAMEEEAGLEEERRLFYVAVTRAKRGLFLTYPLTMGYDTLTFNRPSMFLDELAPHLTEQMEIREAREMGRPQERTSSWSFDDQFNDGEEVISLDRFGEKRRPISKPSTATVWKKKGKK
jgi:DNA helicase-2/ATP-dependent DNA helicase PcrA